MPDLETGRHRLPLLAVSQAQKETTHNEALTLVDALLHPAVESISSAAPVPSDADIGKCWIIGAAPTGIWSGRAGQIAIWAGGSWRFTIAQNGMRIWNKALGRQSQFVAGQWILAPFISSSSGGTVIDAEARATLLALLQYLRSIGILAT